MSLEAVLVEIATVVAEEAARNPAFRDRLERAMERTPAPSIGASNDEPPAMEKPNEPSAKGDPAEATPPKTRRVDAPTKPDGKRRGGRRTPAVLDPVALAVNGEPALRERLKSLDHERLLDIVAQYGMDPGKLVMKWRDPERVIDRIVELSLTRSTKGDAFRKD